MAAIAVEAGKVIHTAGQPFGSVELITSGKVDLVYPGGKVELGKGDVIGICEICNEVHFFEYVAAEKTTLATYQITSLEALEDLLGKNPDAARIFLCSCFRQITYLLGQCSISELKCSDFYRNLKEDFELYSDLCNRYRVQINSFENMDNLTSRFVEEAPDLWLSEYYSGLGNAYTGEGSKALVKNASVSMGMLRKASLDCRKAFQILDEHHRYQSDVAALYFSGDRGDFYEALTGILFRVDAGSKDHSELVEILKRITDQFKGIIDLESDEFKDRLVDFGTDTKSKTSDASDKGTKTIEIDEDLAGSLDTIIKFAGADPGVSLHFREHVVSYKQLQDPDSMDDRAVRLRRAITQEFYEIYTGAFINTINNDEIPLAVWMFLYFGYVDEELAGEKNVAILAKLAKGIMDHSDAGVYTFYDWLMAIREGDKNPSRDEFETDYFDYLNKQRASGTISNEEMKNLEKDPDARVEYELKNFFPNVNKMTFGRITTFCPIFADKNVLKDLETTYVTLSEISRLLQQIRNIDYSAFYREGLDTRNARVMGKEIIHQEFLPDFILMPNVGVRGVMWQEIEGKVRNSPGRMALSIFHMEDLQTTLVRLTGELRWELCKRVQGARWNDVTDPSLTSEYFDYVQFYRKNNDLSADAKEKVRVSLQRAKNSFKEMFVRDYLVWVLFEGNGSPRLNKVAREILFKYCPFHNDVATKLKQNPLYSDIIERRGLKTAQRLHHLDNLKKKLVAAGVKIPDTLEAEIAFAEGKPDQ